MQLLHLTKKERFYWSI